MYILLHVEEEEGKGEALFGFGLQFRVDGKLPFCGQEASAEQGLLISHCGIYCSRSCIGRREALRTLV